MSLTITADGELLTMQCKWAEPAPITSLFKTTVVLTFCKNKPPVEASMSY